ncbi:PREDICTED: uncharacterized protein LOC109592482 [Amphimedon queenslandica]|uniref:Death domain-containing protein n=1 Tax=Amphimedon queenslandica TaxID=400682 RepID=A0A1X7SLE3_AMPQE|nr:PREDICTED: uncharacterized protein LOC109592482 [Amphimedon queenslandica]|eukprot:XP_019863479.1 PREDICTED: uncharacterized protein LOC109592482 [Amphimedon queenslandica]
MSLKITITSKHTLHLINRYTHIEVYFTGPTQHCPLVRKLLTTAIDNSSDAMHLKHNYINAFACPYNESCYCIVNEDHHKVADCTVCGESPALSNDYWTWFNDAQGPDESNNGTQIKQDIDQPSDERPIECNNERQIEQVNDQPSDERHDESKNGTQIKQVNDQPSDENLSLLLDKKPQLNDLLQLFKSYAAQYKVIGVALSVPVDDLLPIPGAATHNLICVFERWIASNEEVSWSKVLQVCDEYPDQLGRAKAEVEEFLSSDRARGGSRWGGPGSKCCHCCAVI